MVIVQQIINQPRQRRLLPLALRSKDDVVQRRSAVLGVAEVDVSSGTAKQQHLVDLTLLRRHVQRRQAAAAGGVDVTPGAHERLYARQRRLMECSIESRAPTGQQLEGLYAAGSGRRDHRRHTVPRRNVHVHPRLQQCQHHARHFQAGVETRHFQTCGKMQCRPPLGVSMRGVSAVFQQEVDGERKALPGRMEEWGLLELVGGGGREAVARDQQPRDVASDPVVAALPHRRKEKRVPASRTKLLHAVTLGQVALNG
mmetsp:Transcript_31125/g.81794  ORF Transcript_31125/g.81794 Transcript_31125/m.81794 type:complete len:256 (-) Transcript_31125:1498-2265(-)